VRGKSNVIKRNIEKVWGARCTLGARYLPKNTVIYIAVFAAWTMHFQIMVKERPVKCIFEVNHILRISILLLHVLAFGAAGAPSSGSPKDPDEIVRMLHHKC
jgi:hypothetical protein